MLEVHRTLRAKILNHNQVAQILDRHGWSASKLWNVANYHSREVWEETGESPDHGDLKDEWKTHNKYKELHSQSSQRVLEELAEVFNSWCKKEEVRRQGESTRLQQTQLLRRSRSSRPRSTPA